MTPLRAGSFTENVKSQSLTGFKFLDNARKNLKVQPFKYFEIGFGFAIYMTMPKSSAIKTFSSSSVIGVPSPTSTPDIIRAFGPGKAVEFVSTSVHSTKSRSSARTERV